MFSRFLIWSFLFFSSVSLVAYGSQEGELLERFSESLRQKNVAEIEKLTPKLAQFNSRKAIKKLGELLRKPPTPELQVLAIENLAQCDPEQSFKILSGQVRKVKGAQAREALFEALDQTATLDFLKEKGIKHSSGLLRGVAFLRLSRQPLELTEELQERIRKEKNPEALVGIAAYLSACLAQDLALTFVKEKLNEIFQSKSFEAKAVVLKSLARTDSEKNLKIIRKNYEHPDWRVRLAVIENVASRGDDKEILDFLVFALRQEEGRLRGDLRNLLKAKIGKDHGFDSNAWMREIHKSKVDFGGVEVRSAHANYYGFEVVSRRIIFVFDKTGSMIVNPRTQLPNYFKKWKAARDNLCDVLRSLDSDLRKNKSRYEKLDPETLTHFTIISFSHDTRWWKKKMIPATSKNIEDACAWVQRLQPQGPTHADLPLREALEFAQGGKRRKGYLDVAHDVDTIFFVTDGAPYKAEFGVGPDSNSRIKQYSQDILEMVKVLNKNLNIVINVVAILGANTRIRFLDDLAESSGGRVLYVPLD